MKKHFVLESVDEYDLSVIAINSHIKGYRLCWHINRLLKTDFEKKEDLRVNKDLYFSRYSYICDQGIEYNILKNQSKNGYLISEHKGINYFLVTENNINKTELIRKLRSVKDILLVFDIDKNEIKQIDRLIF